MKVRSTLVLIFLGFLYPAPGTAYGHAVGHLLPGEAAGSEGILGGAPWRRTVISRAGEMVRINDTTDASGQFTRKKSVTLGSVKANVVVVALIPASAAKTFLTDRIYRSVSFTDTTGSQAAMLWASKTEGNVSFDAATPEQLMQVRYVGSEDHL